MDGGLAELYGSLDDDDEQWCRWCTLRDDDRDGYGLFITVSPGGT